MPIMAGRQLRALVRVLLALSAAAACRRAGLTTAQEPKLDGLAARTLAPRPPDTRVTVEVDCDRERYARVEPYVAIIDQDTELEWALQNSTATSFTVRKKKYIKWPYDDDAYPSGGGPSVKPGKPKGGAKGVYLYNIEIACGTDHFTIDPILIVRSGESLPPGSPP